MKRQRYPGVKPFGIEDKNLFFGRGQDILQLLKLINVEQLIVLYSKSGLGKSSLLNAGIIPILLGENEYQSIATRFGSFLSENTQTPLEMTIHSLKNEERGGTFLEKITSNKTSLWYHLKNAQIASQTNKGFLLVFDQFEELFTYPAEQVSELKEQLADALNSVIPQHYRDVLEQKLMIQKGFLSDDEMAILYRPLDVKVLFAIRSDKMSSMNALKDRFPDILSKSYELLPLSRSQAEEATINPALCEDEGFLSCQFDITDEALDEILNFLTKNNTQKVESFQLQIICRHLEDLVVKEKKSRIERADLADLNTVFENYYEDLIGLLPTEKEREKARVFIEEGLIFEDDESRLSLYEGQIYKSYDISNDLLKKLVNTHLIRVYPNTAGGFSYELSHDTLVGPILKAKRKRKEIEELESARIAELTRIAEAEIERTKFKKRLVALASLGGIVLLILSTLSFYLYRALQEADRAERMAVEEKERADRNAGETDKVNLVLKENEKQLKVALGEANNARNLAVEEKERADRSAGETDNVNLVLKENEKQLKVALGEANNARNLAVEEKERADHNAAETVKVNVVLREKQEELKEALAQAEVAQEQAKLSQRKAEEAYIALNNKIASDLLVKADEATRQKDYNKAKLYSLYALNTENLNEENRERAERNLTKEIPYYPVTVIETEHAQLISDITYHPKNNQLAYSEKGNKTITVLDSITGEKTFTVPTTHESNILSIDYSPDGQFLISSSEKSINLWSVGASKEIFTLEDSKILQVVFSPDNPEFAYVYRKNKFSELGIKLWNWEKNQLVKDIEARTFYDVVSLKYSPDGKLLAFGSGDATIRIQNLRNDDPPYELTHKSSAPGQDFSYITSIDFSPDSKYIVSASTDQTIKIWDVRDRKLIRALSGHEGEINQIIFSRNGKYIASSSDDQTVKLWKVRKSPSFSSRVRDPISINLFGTFTHTGFIEGLAFEREAQQLATASSTERSIKIWNLKGNFSTANIKKTPAERIEEAEKQFNLKKEGVEILPKHTDIEDHFIKAEESFEKNDFKSSEKFYKFILDSNSEAFDASLGVGMVQYGLGNYEKAFAFFQQLYDSKNWIRSKFFLNYSAITLAQLKQNNKAIEILKASLDISEVTELESREDFSDEDLDSLMYLGVINSFAGEYDKALTCLEIATGYSPWVALYWYQLGIVQNEMGSHKKAVESLDMAIANDESYLDAIIERGRSYSLLEQWVDAIQDYEKASQIDQENIPTMQGLGYVFLKQHEFGKAIAQGKKTLDLDPNNINALSLLGEAYIEQKKYDQALEAYKSALNISPQNTAILLSIGAIYGYQKEWDKGIEVEKRIIELTPDDKFAFRNLGFFYARINDHERAINNFNKALDIDPKYVPALYSAGLSYIAQKKYEKALLHFRQVWEIDDSYQTADVWSGRGDVLLGAMQYDLAREVYNKAVQLDPSSEWSWIGIADTYRLTKMFEKSTEFYQKALAINGKNVPALLRLGLVYQALKQYDSALGKFNQAIDLDSKRKDVWVPLGDTYNYKGEKDKALDAYQNALKIDEKYLGALYGLANIYQQNARHDNAIETYEKIIELATPTAYVYSQLALSYFNLKGYHQSMIFSQKALELDPNYSFAHFTLGLAKYDVEDFKAALESFEKVPEEDQSFLSARSVMGAIYFDKIAPSASGTGKEYEKAFMIFRQVLEHGSKEITDLQAFAEANLATNRYKEAYDIAIQALERDSSSGNPVTDTRLAMRNVVFGSLVLRNQMSEARKTLIEFVDDFNSHTEDLKPEEAWSYDGIKHFIQEQPMKEMQRKLLLYLIAILENPTPRINLEDFQEFFQSELTSTVD